jgi:hypothetical protein
MTIRTRTILRLSGRSDERAPEQKSGQLQAAAVFRRFFSALERLDLKRRLRGRDADNDRRPT